MKVFMSRSRPLAALHEGARVLTTLVVKIIFNETFQRVADGAR